MEVEPILAAPAALVIRGVMPVRRLQMKQFGAFASADFEFVDGLNVFIGTNGTGKTHVLKLLYTILQSVGRDTQLHSKLAGVFRPEDDKIGRLVRRKQGLNTATVSLHGQGQGRIAFSLHTKGNLTGPKIIAWRERAPVVFLPSREILALYEGFIAAYQKRELSFDETYYDACVALNAMPVKGVRRVAAEDILVALRKALGGHVELSGDRFYVKFEGDRARMEAHLVAEGLRKVASLERLLLNGSLMENGYLFWDEPEANLNPGLTVIIADILRGLGHAGIQTFITTHDFLLARRLSVSTALPDSPPTRFFAFYRPSAGMPVEVRHADGLSGLPQNPIEEEFAKHYDFEANLSLAEAKP
jgi:energy-coupling factor transporter ATP-binding protein EcfA2